MLPVQEKKQSWYQKPLNIAALGAGALGAGYLGDKYLNGGHLTSSLMSSITGKQSQAPVQPQGPAHEPMRPEVKELGNELDGWGQMNKEKSFYQPRNSHTNAGENIADGVASLGAVGAGGTALGGGLMNGVRSLMGKAPVASGLFHGLGTVAGPIGDYELGNNDTLGNAMGESLGISDQSGRRLTGALSATAGALANKVMGPAGSIAVGAVPNALTSYTNNELNSIGGEDAQSQLSADFVKQFQQYVKSNDLEGLRQLKETMPTLGATPFVSNLPRTQSMINQYYSKL